MCSRNRLKFNTAMADGDCVDGINHGSGAVVLWSASTGEKRIQLAGSHTGAVLALAAGPDDGVFSGGFDRTLRLLRTTSGERVTVTAAGAGQIRCVHLSTAGVLTWAAGGSVFAGSIAELWNANVVPAWMLEDAVLPQEAASGEGRLHELKKALAWRPQSLFAVSADIFYDAARTGDADLLDALCRTHIALPPCHIGTLLLNALESGSSAMVTLVLDVVVRAREESDRIARHRVETPARLLQMLLLQPQLLQLLLLQWLMLRMLMLQLLLL